MFTRRLILPRLPLTRALTTTPRTASNPFLKPTPSPPRLSEKEQAEFERLQRKSTGAFSTPNYAAEGQNPQTQPEAPSGTEEQILHPDIRRGAPPEFEGDVNPKTGEVGGPKNDPLRHGDYSFNGRVTDF